MSIILALICLLQDESVAKLTKQALAKDDAAAKKIVAMGSKAMRPLLAERAKYSGEDLKRLDEFIFEVKKKCDPAASHGSLYQMLVSPKVAIALEETTLETALEFLSDFTPMVIVVDPAQKEKLLKEKLSIKIGDAPFWLVLDAATRGVGGEWAVRYGAIVISTPERLWAEPPRERRKLGEKELKEVEELVPCLGADSMEDREKASARLRELGSGAADRVAKAADSEKDPEIVARCRALLKEWVPESGAVLDERCGIDYQKDESKFLAQLREEALITIKIADIPLDGALKLMLGSKEIGVRVAVPTDNLRISIDYKDVPAYTVLALVTKPYGLDFCVREGKIYVDTAEEIRKFVQEK